MTKCGDRMRPFLIMAAVLGLAATMPVAAQADHWGWHERFGVNVYPYPYAFYSPYPYAYPPGYVVQAPPAVVYQQPATVYQQPAPVYQQPAPAPAASPIFKNAQGQNCVTYQSSVVINNQTQQVKGLACQQADGQWQTVSK